MSRRIWITFQKEGIHRWPGVVEDPNLKDVHFLAHPHRHIFHFRVDIDVYHDDRDIEFIAFKRWCQGLYESGAMMINHMSCEMLADQLSAAIKSNYPNRTFTISVSEDNENGCQIDYA